MRERVARGLRPIATGIVLAGALAGCGSQSIRLDSDTVKAAMPSATSTTSTTSATAHSASVSERQSAARAGTKSAAVSFQRVTLTVPSANSAFGAARTIRVPRGWRAEVWALVPDARLEAFTPEGNLLVSSTDNGTIVELHPHARRGAVPTQSTLISGLDSPQGMAFAKIAGTEYLFVAETDQIDRYVWRHGTIAARRVIVANLPTGGAHPLKNVVVGANGTVYFDIGSATNATPPSGTRLPRATVMAVAANGTHLRVFARGVRNGDGLAFAPNGVLWTAVNERDDIAYPFHRAYGGQADAYGQVIQSYVDEHPPDELAALHAGRNLGWPYCDPDPDRTLGTTGTAFDYAKMRFDADVQTNAGSSVLRCNKLAAIERGLPAHSAPLGFHFLSGTRLPARWQAGAVVAVHGSWDRQPPRAPAVLWLPWNVKTQTLGVPIALISGFQNADGSRWGRPVDAVAGPDGALYVSDDQAGAIYRLVPAGG